MNNWRQIIYKIDVKTIPAGHKVNKRYNRNNELMIRFYKVMKKETIT